MRRGAAIFAIGFLVASREAHADYYVPPPPDDPVFRRVDAQRRAGAVLGFSVGAGFAGASGYPNDVKLIGNPDYESRTPLLVGPATSIFLMGAFSDYVSVGPMVNFGTFKNKDWKSTGFGIGFRVEAFPLVHLVPALADTSVFTQLGIGATEARVTSGGDYPSADGTSSFLGIGVHHEFRLTRLLGGHAAAGPFVEYDAIYAESAERHWLSTGIRVVWYGGTVQADSR